MTLDIPVAVIVAVVVAGVLLVAGWVLSIHPVTGPVVRPVWRRAWLPLTGLVLGVGAVIGLARRKPAPDDPPDDAGAARDLEARARRAETRAALEASRRTAAEAVADTDPAEGWTAIDEEEARLDALLGGEE